MVVVLLAFVLYPNMLVTVPSGEVGVLFKQFSGPGINCWCILSRGTVLDPVELRNEGLHIIWPWDHLFIYDLRLQTMAEKYNAISSDGVAVTAEINIRYQLNHGSVAVLHKFIGPGYFASLVSPEIGSQTRQIISQYKAEQVYISRREIESQIQTAAQKSLGEHLNDLFQRSASEQEDRDLYRNFLQNAIRILDTLVLSIELPPEIISAINSKTQQYYMIQEYKYRAEREVEESKRKQIEANGIAAFQQTVTQGISESYLRWRGIEATLALAQSQNTKIVIIGNGKDGLPIILGNADSVSTPPGTPAIKPPTTPGETPGSTSHSKSEDTSSPSTAEKPGSTPGALTSSDKPDTGSAPKSPVTDSSTVPAKPLSSTLDLSDIKDFISRLAGSSTRPSSAKPSQ